MGYKTPDLKEDIKNTIYDYFNTHGHRLASYDRVLTDQLCDDLAEELCERVDKQFEKIEHK